MTEHASTTEAIYTAVVDVTGGRAGRAVARSGSLELDLSRPAERGGGDGTDPEELFAAGFAACFDSAMAAAARRTRLTIGPTQTTASVSLHVDDQQLYSISAVLHVAAERANKEDLGQVLKMAHTLCPYANAVNGNISLTLTGTAADGEVAL